MGGWNQQQGGFTETENGAVEQIEIP